jgi:hypothetical protein
MGREKERWRTGEVKDGCNISMSDEVYTDVDSEMPNLRISALTKTDKVTQSQRTRKHLA